MSTFERVLKVLGDYTEVNDSITAETSFADLHLDSLDMVDLTMGCEDEFGVPVELDENLKTIGDIVKLIDSQL